MGVDTLLSRLDGVRRTGPDRWIARCPAHDDRRASLSIRETDDGRTLVHDFAGCEVRAVLQAVSLDFEDMFPERATDHRKPRVRRTVPIRDLIAALKHELHVALILLADAGAGRPIEHERAQLARRRIVKFIAELDNAA
jgi:hypothetical protein